jgi:hypothetical protein
VRALSHVFFFNPGPVRRVQIPNRYTAKAKLCFCKNNKRSIIIRDTVMGRDDGLRGLLDLLVLRAGRRRGGRLTPLECQMKAVELR